MTDEDAGELETSYIVVGHISDEFDNPAPVLQWPGSENELEIGDELVRRKDAEQDAEQHRKKALRDVFRRVEEQIQNLKNENNDSWRVLRPVATYLRDELDSKEKPGDAVSE